MTAAPEFRPDYTDSAGFDCLRLACRKFGQLAFVDSLAKCSCGYFSAIDTWLNFYSQCSCHRRFKYFTQFIELSDRCTFWHQIKLRAIIHTIWCPNFTRFGKRHYEKTGTCRSMVII